MYQKLIFSKLCKKNKKKTIHHIFVDYQWSMKNVNDPFHANKLTIIIDRTNVFKYVNQLFTEFLIHN